VTRAGARLRALAFVGVVLAPSVTAASQASADRWDPTLAVTLPVSADDRIPATVTFPPGRAPMPAVVIAHDCSGLGPRSSGAPARWARVLDAHGYITIRGDSFTTRGLPDGVCSDPSPKRTTVDAANRTRDVYAALAYLRDHPAVDRTRIGLMGGSHGGTTTLSAMLALDDADPNAASRRDGFAAAVALYPSCAPSARTWHNATNVYRPAAPLLILIGDKDDWTPAAACQSLAEASRAAGHPVTLKVYPGAHHAFDSDRPVRFVASRINANAPGRRGATTGGHAEAWADAIRQVLAFFGEHLRAR
jgi:dienelactone hydrolase